MTKIALITDTHFGARNDSQVFSDSMKTFYEDIFFPCLKENNIKECIHLGDVFDRRKYINYKSLYDSRQFFFDPLAKNNINVLMIAGNHDVFYKTTNEVNSVSLLLNEYSNIKTFDSPIEITKFNSGSFLLLPWICKENYDESMEAIKTTTSSIMFGHLEIDGFEAHPGYIHDGGFNKNIFNKFDMAFSGHFHHKSDNGTIYYLGNPYELTWQDYKDQRGFHIFDTETRELEFIKNPNRMYYKYLYDDTKLKIEDLDQIDFNQYKNKYIKVVVQEKINPYLFDMVMDKIYKAGTFDITVVENFIDVAGDEEIIDEAQDTVTILSNYIEQLNTNVDKKNLDSLIKTLYNEALTLE